LGQVSASEPSAVAVLITAVQGPAESVRRAATYGLAQAGDAAVPALLQLLKALDGAGGAAATTRRFPYQVDKLIFALGRAAASPSTLEETANCIIAEVQRAQQQLSLMVAALDSNDRAEMKLSATRGNRGYDGKVCTFLNVLSVFRLF
jgi:hypothetical protein